MILPSPSRGAGFWSQPASPASQPASRARSQPDPRLLKWSQMIPKSSQNGAHSMKLWTSILAAIYNTLATFGHLQLDPNASKENFHIAFGTADPPYQKMCQIEWIWRPIRTHPGPKNPPKIHHWPPTSPHCDSKVAPGPHQAPRTMKK